MKTSLRYIFLPIAATILFIFVLLVDISFYKLPNFIKAFRHERELVLTVAFICLFFFIRHLYKSKFRTIRSQLLIIPFSISVYFICVPLIHRIFSEQLILWGNNPLLAARPFQWNLYSTFASIITMSMIFLLLLVIHDLVLYRRKTYTPLLFNLMLALFAFFSLYLNLVDSRYTYTPLQSPITRQTTTSIILIISTSILILTNSTRTQWAKYLTKKGKIITFIAGILILPALVYIYISPERIAYYAYSISVKAFATVSLFFITVYLLFSLITIFFHLPTAGIYDRIRKQMNRINQLSGMMTGIENLQNVLQSIASFSRELLYADVSWLELLNEDKTSLQIYASENLPEKYVKKINLNPRIGLSHHILSSKRPRLIHNIHHDRYCESLVRSSLPIRSLLVAPLIIRDEVKGILFVGKNQAYAFDQEDQEVFQVFVHQASVALENSRLYQDSLEKERISRELKIASEAQLRLLPRELPEIPDYSISAFCKPAREVGGDFYDFFTFEPEKRYVFIIGDVSDKGTAAAFYMSLAKGVLSSLAGNEKNPSKVLTHANKTLMTLFDSKSFLTLIYFTMDAREHKGIFCRAGHTPLIHYKSGTKKTELLNPGGLALSLIDDERFSDTLEEYILTIEPGDILLFYTDGISETRNPSGEEFGEANISKIVEAHADKSPEEIQNFILQEIEAYQEQTPQSDDYTMLIIKRQESNNA